MKLSELRKAARKGVDVEESFIIDIRPMSDFCNTLLQEQDLQKKVNDFFMLPPSNLMCRSKVSAKWEPLKSSDALKLKKSWI